MKSMLWFFSHFGCGFRVSCFLCCLNPEICPGINDSSGALCVLSNLGDLSICSVLMFRGYLVKDLQFSFLGEKIRVLQHDNFSLMEVIYRHKKRINH